MFGYKTLRKTYGTYRFLPVFSLMPFEGPVELGRNDYAALRIADICLCLWYDSPRGWKAEGPSRSVSNEEAVIYGPIYFSVLLFVPHVCLQLLHTFHILYVAFPRSI